MFPSGRRKQCGRCFYSRENYFITGFSPNGDTKHILACIMFTSTPQGIWVNWIGVTSWEFDPLHFGRMANQSPFCQCGIATLLLLLAQMHSAAQGCLSLC